MLIQAFLILSIPANVVWILFKNYWDVDHIMKKDPRITFQFSQCWINFQFIKVASKIEGTLAAENCFKIAAAMYLFQFYHFIGFKYVL